MIEWEGGEEDSMVGEMEGYNHCKCSERMRVERERVVGQAIEMGEGQRYAEMGKRRGKE